MLETRNKREINSIRLLTLLSAMNSMLKEGLKGAKVANNEKKKVAKRKA